MGDQLIRLQVPLDDGNDAAVGAGEHQCRIAGDLQALRQRRLALRINPDGNELLIEQRDDRRVAKRGRIELLAPEAILGDEIEQQRPLLLGGLAASGIVVGAPSRCWPLAQGRRAGER